MMIDRLAGNAAWARATRPDAWRQTIFTRQAAHLLRPFCGANAAVPWAKPVTATAAAS